MTKESNRKFWYNSARFITHLQCNLTPTLEFTLVKVLREEHEVTGQTTLANKPSCLNSYSILQGIYGGGFQDI